MDIQYLANKPGCDSEWEEVCSLFSVLLFLFSCLWWINRGWDNKSALGHPFSRHASDTTDRILTELERMSCVCFVPVEIWRKGGNQLVIHNIFETTDQFLTKNLKNWCVSLPLSLIEFRLITFSTLSTLFVHSSLIYICLRHRWLNLKKTWGNDASYCCIQAFKMALNGPRQNYYGSN